ncbi:amino acid permease [Natrinema pellirubrum DSM 15624]|uniref:Amino acid permease n=1 Tax=Natrinema pellirubrum (strain DSM 15624 / CIP 106293 / JCM 10476 / NCIMB 786 / 157) TaxID=797303 RepID=L0JR94_NATP1|nr:amino acid permease [Natrinema pellirubrum]AGB33313.1 amino acid transporter [Natrinema pellirubrum DSM 15624]ELY71682.1 amino acid permease [Natrinema pellirubrum DSM 15624]
MSASGDTDAATLSSSIGIVGVLALLVGNAISVPIFVLPGPLAGTAGPSLVVAILLAAIPASFVVLYNALLGSAMPVAGGLYVYISRLTAPYWGFLVPVTIPLVAWASLLITATGFAEYIRIFVDVPSTPLIYVLLAFVLLVNLIGLRVVAQVQLVFFAGLVIALLTFIVPGATAVDAANYAPFFPDYGAFGLAVVALFYPFLGFGLLVELGEEIEDPGRTIPLVLGLGIGIVALFYVALIAVLVGVVPYTELGAEADLAMAATRFLPWWGEYVVAAGAVFAVVTTVNTTLLVFSRTLMRASRDGILPASLARIHPRFDTPHYAVALLGLPPFVLVPIADEIVGLSVFIGLASLTAYFFCAIGLWNLPREFPAHYANAPFRLRRYRGLLLAVLGGAVATGAFWIVTLLQRPIVGVVLVGWFVVAYGYYRYRLAKTDRIETYRTMTSLDRHERIEESETHHASGDASGDSRRADAGEGGD